MPLVKKAGAGFKPPTTRLQDTVGYHASYTTFLPYLTGGLSIQSAGTGVPVTELDVSGSGYLQFLMAGTVSNPAISINLTLTLDGVELYNYTAPNTDSVGPLAVGGVYFDRAGNEGAVTLEMIRFESGFTVDMTASSTNAYLIYKYYLDS